MTPLNSNFTVSLANVARTAPRPTPEFVVEVAQDGFQGSVVQGLPVEKEIIQAQPVIIEAQPDPHHQSPCLLTPPTQEPPHEDGWYLSH